MRKAKRFRTFRVCSSVWAGILSTWFALGLNGCLDARVSAVTGSAVIEDRLVAGQEPSLVAAFAPSQNTPGLPSMPRRITIGETVSGTLVDGDQTISDGRRADDYIVNLVAGVPITIVLRGGAPVEDPSGHLDMYLILMRHGAEIVHDDDSASNGSALNSRIVYTPTETGAFIIRATTYGSSRNLGQYEIQTYAGALPSQT